MSQRALYNVFTLSTNLKKVLFQFNTLNCENYVMDLCFVRLCFFVLLCHTDTVKVKMVTYPAFISGERPQVHLHALFQAPD